ncbi:hypothetical protein BRC94_12820 [Halobacteriales archaeon QS_5_70_17]|nr:MAG: hypothetical protein BRC94_12820 [Halobacteriales archaeon QS_5_70_17]
MRRDYFTLDVDRGAGDATKPVATVSFDGPEDPFEDRLTDDSGAPLAADQVDVSYRLREGEELDSDATGAFAITDRITGDYVLEANVGAGVVLDLVEAARAYGNAADTDDGRYRVVVRVDGREALAHEKSTFLVYDRDGELLRQHSLIPSGVEL